MSQRADASVQEIGQLSNIVVCELLNELQGDLCFLYQLAEVGRWQNWCGACNGVSGRQNVSAIIVLRNLRQTHLKKVCGASYGC